MRGEESKSRSEFTLQTRMRSNTQTTGAKREETSVMWIATVITAHGLTLFGWWLRLHWQTQQKHAHRQDLIALARALPDGG